MSESCVAYVSLAQWPHLEWGHRSVGPAVQDTLIQQSARPGEECESITINQVTHWKGCSVCLVYFHVS